MKHAISTFILSIVAIITFAQQPPNFDSTLQKNGFRADTARKIIRICAPSRYNLQQPPLYIIRSHHRKFKFLGDSSLANIINPYSIQSIRVFRDASVIKQYGDSAKNGVIDITLKNKPRDSYKKLKQKLKEGKVKEIK